MGRPVKCDLKYVNSFRDRHGKKWRYYFRKDGKSVPLPGNPGSLDFLTAYNKALEAPRPVVAAEQIGKPGTLFAMRAEYFNSAEFAALATTTQRETRYVIEAVCRAPNKFAPGVRGDNLASKLERRHILKWRDEMKDKPGAANKMLGVLKTWFTFGVDRGYFEKNPAQGIKRLKLNKFVDWTDEELAQFEERHPLGTVKRCIYALALYTLQRRKDIAKIGRKMTAGTTMRITQSKTGAILEIPMHPALTEALAAMPPKGETYLTDANGKPLSIIYIGALMREAIQEAGLPKHCKLHGLRYTGARILEELGHRPRAMTGHATQQMENNYSRRANQKHNAKAAVLSWAAADKKRKKAAKSG